MFAADSNLLSCHMVSGMHNDVNNDAPNRNLRRFEMRTAWHVWLLLTDRQMVSGFVYLLQLNAT